MPFVSVGSENGASIDIYYEDHGSGQPVVLIHGYPLNGRSWERQERDLLAAGYRVIAYDRRGFGNSSQPVTGYDYDTFTADLNAVLEHLNLTDIYLCGFSMGTGEVTHYLGTHGSARVKKAALLGAIPPFLLKTGDNPEGVDKSVFEGIKSAIVADRYAYFSDFFANFYNTDVLGGTKISEQAVQASFNVAAAASPYATYACVDTWLTDFRADLLNIDVPVLVLHGTADRILPFENTAKRLPGLIKDVTVIPVENGPHNIGWTYPERRQPRPAVLPGQLTLRPPWGCPARSHVTRAGQGGMGPVAPITPCAPRRPTGPPGWPPQPRWRAAISMPARSLALLVPARRRTWSPRAGRGG